VISLSDRLVELKVENMRLKKEVQNLESKILNLVGMIEIDQSGGEGHKNLVNEKIIEMLHSSEEFMNLVTPKVDNFYTRELINAANKQISISLIINERSTIPPIYQTYYDQLKGTPNINIVNNPNVRYLLLLNEKEAIYSGGSLDRDELERSILILTRIKAQDKLKKIAEIFQLMLPSFMRK